MGALAALTRIEALSGPLGQPPGAVSPAEP
jgi:hypothetical protein